MFLVIAVIPLIAVVAYVVAKGLPAWNADFFTHSTVPEGIPGGGVWNAIVGTIVITGIAVRGDGAAGPGRPACSWPSRMDGSPPPCGSRPT